MSGLAHFGWHTSSQVGLAQRLLGRRACTIHAGAARQRRLILHTVAEDIRSGSTSSPGSVVLRCFSSRSSFRFSSTGSGSLWLGRSKAPRCSGSFTAFLIRVCGPPAPCFWFVAFVRLALNPAILEYHVRGDTAVFNWYLYAYGLGIVALFVGVRLLAPPRQTVLGINAQRLVCALGVILSFLLLNIEIADYFTLPGASALTFEFSGNFARDMCYTIGWALFALGLLSAGIWKQHGTRAMPPSRSSVLRCSSSSFTTWRALRLFTALGRFSPSPSSPSWRRLPISTSFRAMKRPSLRGLSPVVLLALLAAASCPALTPTEWQHRQALNVAAPGLVRVDLTPASFDAAGQ